MKNPFGLTGPILCYLTIAVSILVFVYSGLYRSLDILDSDSVETDFFHWYAAGELWNDGVNPYEYETYRARYERTVQGKQLRERSAYYYPPHMTMLFGLLSRMPLRIAYSQLQTINLFLLLSTLAMLAYILSWYRPLRLPEITLLISFLATGFARLNLREGQLGPLLAVLVLGTFILARSKKDVLAGMALGGLSLKPTFLPLYALYFLLGRSYRLVIIGGLVAVLLTVMPMLLTQQSVPETLISWVQSLSRQNAAGNVDDPSPLNRTSNLMSHLEPLVYRVLNGKTPLTTAIAWRIVLVLIGLVVYLLWHRRSSGKGELVDFGLISALSMIAIYHRPYDSFLLFPGILYIYLHARNAVDRAIQRRWILFIATIILLLIVPINTPLRLIGMYPNLVDYYLWRVVAPFQAWISLVVFGALLWLKIKQPLSKEQQEALVPGEQVPYDKKLNKAGVS